MRKFLVAMLLGSALFASSSVALASEDDHTGDEFISSSECQTQEPSSASARPVLKQGHYGVTVGYLQNALGFSEKNQDGCFGPGTDFWVRKYQTSEGLRYVDGIVGDCTWKALFNEELPSQCLPKEDTPTVQSTVSSTTKSTKSGTDCSLDTSKHIDHVKVVMCVDVSADVATFRYVENGIVGSKIGASFPATASVYVDGPGTDDVITPIGTYLVRKCVDESYVKKLKNFCTFIYAPGTYGALGIHAYHKVGKSYDSHGCVRVTPYISWKVRTYVEQGSFALVVAP